MSDEIILMKNSSTKSKILKKIRKLLINIYLFQMIQQIE